VRLLLVDDDAAFRALLRTTFEVFDLEVDEADSASMAARRISAYPPDAIVLDVMMPGIDGVEVCRRLDHENVKVIILTARDDPRLEDACREAGADAFLTKPFSSVELLDLVQELMAA